jgi:hypothetical protein
MANQQSNEPQKEESFTDKLSKKFEEFKSADQWQSCSHFMKENTMDTAAYFLLILGLIFLFISPHLGGFLIGLVGGYYFSGEIIDRVKSWKHFLEKHGAVKSLVYAAILLAIFISAPWLLVTAFVVAGLKYFMSEEVR